MHVQRVMFWLVVFFLFHTGALFEPLGRRALAAAPPGQ